jgi:hypothetical protein
MSPEVLSTASTINNITLFDSSAASNTPMNTVWERTNITPPIPAGSILLHDIKVSAYIDPGANWPFPDGPLEGHEFIFQRKISPDVSYGWSSDLSHQSVKHVFNTQNVHEEQSYTITETIPSLSNYTHWRCDISGIGARTDNTDRLTWKIIVIAPSEFVNYPTGQNVTFNDITSTGVLSAQSSTLKTISITDGSLIIMGDISVNGQIFSSGGGGASGGGGVSPGQDVSFHDIDASGDIVAIGDITAFFSSSDRRLKTNINDINNFENIIKNVRGVRFNWNETAKSINMNVDLSKVELGVIAQEVEEYIPEIIKNGLEKYKAVRYEKITPILIECIKDLYKRIEVLEKRA